MRENLWTRDAAALAAAYARGAGSVRFELVTRALRHHLPPGRRRVVDIGGGYGQQAILLARDGHEVAIVDPDPTMLALAEDRLGREPAAVRARVTIARGFDADAEALVGAGFDLVCCHSVLMYEAEPTRLLRTLVRLARPGGLLSIVSINRSAGAMRSGLQGRWEEAAASLRAGRVRDGRYLEGEEHTPEEVDACLAASGARTLAWYGIGVFTDHVTQPIVVDDPELIYATEYLAGETDPYRRVARCFHLVAETA